MYYYIKKLGSKCIKDLHFKGRMRRLQHNRGDDVFVTVTILDQASFDQVGIKIFHLGKLIGSSSIVGEELSW